MKKYILSLLITLISFVSKSQSTAQPMTGVYCFGNTEHNFVSNLSSQAKIELDKIVKKYKIDTTNLYRVKYSEIFTKYGSIDYLSKHSYTYINWFKIDDNVKSQEKVLMNGYSPQSPDKLILLYTTNHKNIESLSFYITN
jgi:hypothetical protein